MAFQNENGTKKEKKLPFYQEIDGFLIPGVYSPELFRSALKYKPRPDDLFIVTYPRCGTTWVQCIVACIYKNGKPFESALEYLSQSPFLHLTGAEGAEKMKVPGAIKMHFPFSATPWSPKAKYIFIARNPKDCCVSFYHYHINIPTYKFQDGEFDDFFELFMEGKVVFGEYFHILLSWYEHRNDPNVLFITYEELKKDPRAGVLKIAEFMGRKYKEVLEKDEKLLNDVIYHSSFDFMKVHFNKHLAELTQTPKELIRNNPDILTGIRKVFGAGVEVFKSDPKVVNFVRKGVVGDWRNYFSPEQNERLEKKFKEKTAGTDIPELWKDYM